MGADKPNHQRVFDLLTFASNGSQIIREEVSNFSGFCGHTFNGKVETVGLHDEKCPWRYFLRCPKCRYQNNLAKVLRPPLQCECVSKKQK